MQICPALCIMGYMSTHRIWFQALVGHDTEKAASDKAGITTSTLNRQLAKGVLSEGNVIALARAYRQNPVEALVRTGFLEKDEVLALKGLSARLLTDQELIHELALRVDSDEAAWEETFSSAVSQPQTPQSASVHDIHDRDALIERINAGVEPVAAQEATEPLEQDWT